MVVERLALHYTPVTTVDELWHCVEAAWASVPVHVIQSLFDSMPRRISAVITPRGGCSGTIINREKNQGLWGVPDPQDPLVCATAGVSSVRILKTRRVKGLMQVESIKAQCPPFGVVWYFKEGEPAQVSPSSLDRGSE
ncbi:uncharacterized protein TNCV_2997941 [Trichonephila clavipes]|nr:uncharacterized protein TNCV_2997941 [Trichonephila clavipes]